MYIWEKEASGVIQDPGRGAPSPSIGMGEGVSPYERGVKYAQACVVQMKDGRWKLFIQSNKQIEMQIIGSLEDIFKELKHATSTREWERQAKY